MNFSYTVRGDEPLAFTSPRQGRRAGSGKRLNRTTLRQPCIKMWHMDHNARDTKIFAIECGTCVATGTTACTDCVVAHLLANDDGPIGLVSVAVERPPSATERAISLFELAGLLDDPIQFVEMAAFDHALEAPLHAVP